MSHSATTSPPAGGQTKNDSELLREALAAAHLVDPQLLDRALAIQASQGRWLGSILIELGAMSPDDLAALLAKTLSLKVADLSSAAYDVQALRVLPETMARRFNAVPLSYFEGRLALAMVNPMDTLACDLIQARTGARLERLVATEREVKAALDRLYQQLARDAKQAAAAAAASAAASSSPASSAVVKRQANEPEPEDIEIVHVDELLTMMMERKASDLHLSANSCPTMRIDGELVPVTQERLGPKQIHELIYAILTDGQIRELEETWELDFAYSITGLSRFRVNVHRQRGSIGAVFRAVPVDPPSLEALGMPRVLKTLAMRPRGLVLVTGPTGSGKSTTLAAMIREINVARRCHIVTIEDPIEFLHRNERSIIIQREVGSDTRGFAVALRHVLRQDPDVILIGEMRDLETISAAVTAAETGHLVLATLHTTSAAQTIDRIVDVFPPFQQEQIRVQLSSVIEGILCQTLLPLSDGKGRTCAQEILIATSAIRNLIREGKTHQMASVLQSGSAEGMQTLDQALKVLVLGAKISPQAAIAVSSNPSDFQAFLRMR